MRCLLTASNKWSLTAVITAKLTFIYGRDVIPVSDIGTTCITIKMLYIVSHYLGILCIFYNDKYYFIHLYHVYTMYIKHLNILFSFEHILFAPVYKVADRLKKCVFYGAKCRML